MNTIAWWITAGVFAGLATLLAQINHLQFSFFFGVLSVASCLFALFAHRKENKQVEKVLPDATSLIVSDLYHPNLRDSRYSNSVLWFSIVNKSDIIVTINNVLAYDRSEKLLPTAWSNGLKDNLGNLNDFTGLLAIKSKDTASLYLRHRHGTDIYICRIEINHSLSDKPIAKRFDAYAGWNL